MINEKVYVNLSFYVHCNKLSFQLKERKKGVARPKWLAHNL